MLQEFLIYALSIGFSDAIELYLHPYVHKIHNAPDIIKKDWKDYTYADAFLSGFICSFPILLELLIFYFLGIEPKYLLILSILCVLIPIYAYISNKQTDDPFFSHKMLYLFGLIYFTLHISNWILIKLLNFL